MYRWLFTMLLAISLIANQISGFAASKEWSSDEKLAKKIKPAIVRVVSYYWATWSIGNAQIDTYYGGYGSGAIINPDGYIVTNAHVVDTCTHSDAQKQVMLARQLEYLLEKHNIPKEYTAALIKHKLLRIGEIHTVNAVITPGGEELPFELKEIGSPTGEKDGKDVAVIKVEGRNFPTVRLGDSDKIRTGERIFVAGYPAAADLGSAGSRKSVLEWSWSPGTISSDKKATAQGAPLIQVNAEGVTPGNSGGPVFTGEGRVIGLLTFSMNTAGGSSGSLYCMASRTVQEFIRKAGANNEESLTDKAYLEGLEFYWQGYYSKALIKFEEAGRLYPKHSEVQDLIAECQKNIAEGKDNRYWPDYYPYIAVILTVLIICIAYLVWARHRKSKEIALQIPDDH